MKCLCGHNDMKRVVTHNTPDKYEAWVGIEDPYREWMKCTRCGLYKQYRSYPLSDIEKIYFDGYRSEKFRGETIADAFKRIITIPNDEQENAFRWQFFKERAPGCGNSGRLNIIDIGSGLGVWPFKLHNENNAVHCVELNKDSREFINSIGIYCTEEIPNKTFDVLSIVHVLEHMENPAEWLSSLKGLSQRVFIEVPDAVEFDYLPKTHDEFNSCHVWFFSPSTLIRTVESSGYKTTALETVRTKERNLSRIFLMAER